MTIIEAIPNFSEGRRPEVVAALVEAIGAPGVRVLHVTSDWDHNRTVITVAGAPEAVLEGLFRAVAEAARRINLLEQRGAHPRLGATDVAPLVPIEGITLAECAVLAAQLGERIGTELGLPVYLYEAAATRSDRRNLADVRRGQFEGLVENIHLPERAPDFGRATRQYIVGRFKVSEAVRARREERLRNDIARLDNDLAILDALKARCPRIHMFISLDLSTQHDEVGVFNCGWYYSQAHLLRFYSPIGKFFSE
ncbi:MAG: hypothetical protein ACK2U9_14650, partial [Anaerolineae bacterium]